MTKYRVIRSANKRQWDIVDKAGKIVEGGFFYKDSALDALEAWNTPEQAPDSPSLGDRHPATSYAH